MRVTINGKSEEVQDSITVRELLLARRLNPNTVACELNLEILKRARLAETTLKEGDTLEVIQMIGGG